MAQRSGARPPDCDVDASTAYLLAQTLIGTWPIDADRLTGYLEKAVREAKLFTTWNDPNDPYEQRVLDLARSCLSGPVADILDRVVEANAPLARVTTLASQAASAHPARGAGRLPGHGAGRSRLSSTRTTDDRSTTRGVESLLDELDTTTGPGRSAARISTPRSSGSPAGCCGCAETGRSCSTSGRPTHHWSADRHTCWASCAAIGSRPW